MSEHGLVPYAHPGSYLPAGTASDTGTCESLANMALVGAIVGGCGATRSSWSTPCAARVERRSPAFAPRRPADPGAPATPLNPTRCQPNGARKWTTR
jgi:hypothetical protein